MEPGLRRSVGLLHATGFGLGAMVGTGVFVYVAQAAGMAGPAMLLGLALAAGVALLNGLSTSQLAALFPRSGATYEYASRTLSPWAGFAAGWLFLVAKSCSAAATALGFGHYLAGPLHAPPLAISLALIGVVTAIHLVRLVGAGIVNVLLFAVTLGALLVFVASGLGAVSAERFRPFAPHGWLQIFPAGALLFVAFAGYGRAATLGEEVHEPEKTIPRAILLSIAISFLLYIAVSGVAIGSIGAEAFAAAVGHEGPLERAAATPFARMAVAVGSATALGSVFLNLTLAISRMLFAMGRGGDLPRALTFVNRESSPAVAVLVASVAIAGLALSQALVALLSISAFAVLLYYGVTHLSALRLGRQQRRYSPAVPAAGLVACLGLAASVPPRQLAVGAAALALGALWRVCWRRITSSGASKRTPTS